jgi:hypothetical protein
MAGAFPRYTSTALAADFIHSAFGSSLIEQLLTGREDFPAFLFFVAILKSINSKEWRSADKKSKYEGSHLVFSLYPCLPRIFYPLFHGIFQVA